MIVEKISIFLKVRISSKFVSLTRIGGTIEIFLKFKNLLIIDEDAFGVVSRLPNLAFALITYSALLQ